MALGSTIGGIAGGALGSAFPVVGNAIGGGIGAGIGGLVDALVSRSRNKGMQQMGGQGRESGFKQFFAGAPSGFEQTSPYNQQQQQLFGQIGQQGYNQLQNPYQGFEPIQQRAMTQFNRQELPSLYERLNAFGENASTSPTFSAQAGLAQNDLAERLAAMQSQYGLANQQQALQMLQLGLTPQFQNYWNPGSEGLLSKLAPSVGMASLQGLAGYGANRPGTSPGMQNFLNAFSSSLQGQRGKVE